VVAAHDADDAGAVTRRAALDHRVEAVLGGERVLHLAPAQPDPDEAPVADAEPCQVVEVHGLVGAVEVADAHVHDRRHERRPVVRRNRHAVGVAVEGG
jgi:hypothetical protein